MAFVLGILVIVSLAASGAWDVYALTADPQKETVSQVIGDLARRFPPATIAIGILIGHLFWPASPPINKGS